MDTGFQNSLQATSPIVGLQREHYGTPPYYLLYSLDRKEAN